jgi:molybdopterin biosynthesis enzyme
LLDGRLLVGLPGNPLAAMVGLVTLVQPVLSGFAGAGLQSPSRARLAGTSRCGAQATRRARPAMGVPRCCVAPRWPMRSR